MRKRSLGLSMGEVWETQQVELKPLKPKLSFDLSIMRSTMVELTTHMRDMTILWDPWALKNLKGAMDYLASHQIQLPRL